MAPSEMRCMRMIVRCDNGRHSPHSSNSLNFVTLTRVTYTDRRQPACPEGRSHSPVLVEQYIETSKSARASRTRSTKRQEVWDGSMSSYVSLPDSPGRMRFIACNPDGPTS